MGVWFTYMPKYFGNSGPEKPYANINNIRYLNFRIDKKGTLLDYIEYLQTGGFYKVKDDPNFGIDVLNYYKDKIKEFGGRSISDMTPEEIEQNSKL